MAEEAHLPLADDDENPGLGDLGLSEEALIAFDDGQEKFLS